MQRLKMADDNEKVSVIANEPDSQEPCHAMEDLEGRYLQLEPMDFMDEELATSTSSMKDTRFDIIIGHIEDIIMEKEFQSLQDEFMDKHYLEFENTDENKFVYTDIHTEYCKLIERHIERELEDRIEHFDMADFAAQLERRKDELEGEIFEMLLTFSDFVSFKEMFLDYRAMREEKTVDLSTGITVTPLKLDSSVDLALEPTSSSATSHTKHEGGGDQCTDNVNGEGSS